MVPLAPLLILLACQQAEEPSPPTAPAAEYIGDAGQLYARAAPGAGPAWHGPWDVTVFAKTPSAPSVVTLAEALGSDLELSDGNRPDVRRGQLAVLWLEPGAGFDIAPSPGGRGQGAVVAIMGPGDDDWAARGAAELPWAAVGVVDAAASLGLWVEPSLGTEQPALAGAVAARVVAAHYGLPWTPPTLPTAPPGLAQHLGTAPADPTAQDPRARATGLTAAGADAALHDAEVAVRIGAAHATASQASLVALADDPDPLVRARATDRLEALDTLDTLTRDPSSVVRLVATHRLADLANQGHDEPALASTLRELAASSPDAYLRWKAAWGLGALEGQSDVLAKLATDPDVDVRRDAAAALGRQGDPAALDPLLTLLADPNNFLRAVAARGLGELGEPGAIPALRSAVEDPTAQVSDAAAKALSKLGQQARGRGFRPPPPPKDDDALRALLASQDGTVLKDACKFAAGRADAPALLGPLLGHPDGEVRKAAVQALGWSPEVTPKLIPMLGDPDLDVVVTTLESLRRTGGFDPVVLEPSLAHADSELRLRAAEALAALGPSERLRGLADDPDERIRAAVARVHPELFDHSEPSVLVRRAAAAASPSAPRWREDASALVRFVATPSVDPHGAYWARGVIAREDDLVYLRFSFNDERDRPSTSRSLLPPVVREYGHPDRG